MDELHEIDYPKRTRSITMLPGCWLTTRSGRIYSAHGLGDPENRTQPRTGSDRCVLDSAMEIDLRSPQPAHQPKPLARPKALLRVTFDQRRARLGELKNRIVQHSPVRTRFVVLYPRRDLVEARPASYLDRPRGAHHPLGQAGREIPYTQENQE